jgi:hypothetical protein
MVAAQTWRTCRRPEFSAGFTLAADRFGSRMRKYHARAKPRPITSDEEVTDQLYESDNDDRDQWTRVPVAENVGVNGQWVDDRKRETIRTRRVVGCPGQKKSSRSNQAATTKDRSRKNLSRKESQNYRRRVDRRGVGRH